MPRKTKDDELKEEKKVAKKTDSKKKTPTKSTKKTATKKESTVAKVTTTAKKRTTSTSTKTTPKKTDTKESSTTKKTVAKKDDSKKASSTKKTTAKKVDSKKASSTKKTTAKKTTTKKSSSKKSVVEPSLPILEYYDLPYRYNQTVVKVLAQNPHTLFVYWDISDEDKKFFKEQYGDNFFNVTKPVLVVNNLTDNYTYEVEINDFANNWYINVDDAKCEYSVILGRRARQHAQDIKYDYLDVAYSNTIEIPNDRILYFKENDKIHFKNIKTNKVTTKIFKNHIYGNGIHEIYKNYNIPENQDKMTITNPSSDFLSSNIL